MMVVDDVDGDGCCLSVSFLLRVLLIYSDVRGEISRKDAKPDIACYRLA